MLKEWMRFTDDVERQRRGVMRQLKLVTQASMVLHVREEVIRLV